MYLRSKRVFLNKVFFMKKLVICLFISLIGYTVHAQRFHIFKNDWKASVGFNALGNLGTRNPVEKLDQYAFKFPIAVAIERQWDDRFAAELDISLNGFDAGKFLDNGVPNEDLTYFSTNLNFKWYFSDHFVENDWLDLYAMGGLGIFQISELNSSINLSGGAQFWVDEDIAIRLQTTGKFAFNAKNHTYANNHWQHVLQVVFRF